MNDYSEINGILLLDKATGITSNKALQQVKRLLGTKSKAGHTGSLDPLATGMLPICFGEATKFSGFLLNSDKKYLVTAQFGIQTDTADIDGKVIASQDLENYNFDNAEIKSGINAVLATFIGETWQVPPMYSAIKIQGVRLYKLARAQQTEDLVVQPRLIRIYEIKLIAICNITKQITLEVHCSKGTYIRALIEDVAKKLNYLATVASLRRIEIGSFTGAKMINVLELERLLLSENNINQLLLPVSACLASLPKLQLDLANEKLLRNGQIAYINDLSLQFSPESLICLITVDNSLLGVGKVLEENKLIANRLVKL